MPQVFRAAVSDGTSKQPKDAQQSGESAMKFLRRAFFFVVAVFIVLQFFRPAKNHWAGADGNEIQKHFLVPADVQEVLRNSCYDCHSNNTHYPWYAEVQPVGWLLANDIQEGKSELNFDEFGSYRAMRKYRKFKEIQDQVDRREMPMPSYVMMHGKAELTEETKALLINWTTAMRDSMKAHFPIDSLERRLPG
jgi:hypothetical protein